MTAQALLNKKLAEIGIDSDFTAELTGRYQSIVDAHEVKNFGDLSPIYKWVKVDVKAAIVVNEHDTELHIKLNYWWAHTHGGSNGYEVNQLYSILNKE